MKKVERYFYPAIFIYEPDQEIAVKFPDLKCATSGVDDDDALLSARELLGIVMNGLEEDGEDIPAPTPLDQVATRPNERAVLVDVYMPSIRQAHNNRSVNRTVTLPAWLNAAALERNVNFSQVLQDALKNLLHMESANTGA
ncbi:MAG: type II toxin-antitoxin system HicB family antitoxin [Lachnospiraceae bacterium]|nr:type II toxin-antitoxin system HicB family antitoxin [Lachnospiraceae bacterium]